VVDDAAIPFFVNGADLNIVGVVHVEGKRGDDCSGEGQGHENKAHREMLAVEVRG
jgi:predicted ribosome-associated RNA-binding protein Tma20